MSTTEQTTKKNFTNYKVFGFWLAKSFKDQGVIDQSVYDSWIKTQELHGTKEAQEEFYGKFFESIPIITQELKDLSKVEKESGKDAAKAAKIAEKEAAKAAKIAEKEAAKEAAKAERLAVRKAAREAAKAEKKMTKDAEKVESTIVADSDDEKSSVRPSTPVLETEEETMPVEIPAVIEAETDKLMDDLLQEVLSDSTTELTKEEYVEEVGEALYLEVTDPKKKKTMYIRRPVQINNILFADTDMKEQIKGFCVLSDAKEDSDPIFQYQRGKKIK